MRGIPVAKEGWPFLLISLASVIAAWFCGVWQIEFLLAPVFVFVAAFFRDPERLVPNDENSIVSPADGKVIKIEKVFEGRLLKHDALKISIFMNVFNVHVNRAPASGRVAKILYNPGNFFNASLDKASMENEQNALLLECASGRRLMFNQIAGLIARRIVCRVKAGDSLKKGERFGMIRFGSRLDVYLPVMSRVNIKLNDKVKAGTSILGYWP
ncbi:MAG: phosphatidylserine decarboxylase family protein [Deltaproteobacteria bacterium]|nr:phosphatidylserine decarboxylase family protein [Deltaproteobacteria bacterium]